ncbi:FKBP-type peptidyl-prolyl cis-trans isomerase [Dasania sp. GY-MA-18]|uniref:Peptidyl-prolyl cis-trans isomerase n=1 Tax=Dasania phycosphaerae TaxID=2950436 RepID=A0A9J6RJW0_9GAMM|nr:MULTISPECIES: FKBP-type peptidyl-prolyl cis-trans isomerase [Dasania]MCR8922221.1 FKBP-type peptidyl-prolyl cis-trans isomerase [Dasania sp. GY-MA-18]MCZ0864649.1 FKBP-type peptidyl-prolyl cis-trans isomerase [Dasania phycosphaerae]MCZ0868377.1 FKBP-type peptidyl-prolyl cis-trans isomerase [Dasania phycosphaerae]
MKRNLLVAAAITAALAGCNQQAADKTVKLDDSAKRVSYGMGIGLGERIAQESIEVDADAFALGMKHALEGSERLMTQEEVMAEMQTFQQQQMEKQQAAQAAIADQNQQAGEAFLAENATKEGVVTLDSGLQYSVITEGSGAKPSETDTVEVHYRGTLIDGTEFDSSYKRNSTVSFPVNGVIAGWTEALQLMPVGSKWNLYIPSDLAYGPGGTGGPIGPNATLIFEVELVSIKDDSAEAEG